jgi:hydroxyacylglutathione hydrolase
MYIQQFYTQCLSEAAYYIESEGEVAIIDPLRDTDAYIDLAKERNAKIKYVLETHFHADFVSGHLDLSKRTGAPIYFGPLARTHYQVQTLEDGETLTLGKLSIKALHTPGHTMESTCYLLNDETGNPHALFSGDTLFVGDVGRPDLSSGNTGSDELAGILFDSLQQKILPLPDHVLLYPAHGPGSSCGKQLGPQTHSTIGEQRQNNYALKADTKEAFVESVLDGLNPPPNYFSVNASINQRGYQPLEEILNNGSKALSIEAFQQALNDGAWIIDTRTTEKFTQGFIPGSVFIGLDGRMAEWAGQLIPYDQELLIISETGKEMETITRLARVGFEKFHGTLAGGFEKWQKENMPIDIIIDVEADELVMDIPHDSNLVVVDVRNENEFENGHLKDAMNLPLKEMNNLIELAQFEEHQNLYVHCAGGYRSVIACSLLKRQGMSNLRNVLGGWNSIRQQEKAPIINH